MNKQRKTAWLVIGLLAFGASFGTFWLAETFLLKDSSTRELTIENGLQNVNIDDTDYLVVKVENHTAENLYKLELYSSSTEWDLEVAEDKSGFGEGSQEEYRKTPSSKELTGEKFEITHTLTISSDIYSKALQRTVTLKEKKENKDKKPSFFLSLFIGGATFAILAVSQLREPKTRGEAATLLIENNLENARVRDVEILANIMKMGEFTVPQIKKRVGTSKATAYRTVNELVDIGLVKETEKEKTPNSVRGKPSKVYRYIGPES